jgi:hypothetical protein
MPQPASRFHQARAGAAGGALVGNNNAHRHGRYSASAIRNRQMISTLIRRSRELEEMA